MPEKIIYHEVNIDGQIGYVWYDKKGKRLGQANLPGNYDSKIDKLQKTTDWPGSDVTALEAAKKLGLILDNNEGELNIAIDKLFDTNPPALQDYRNGKLSAIGALIGIVKKTSKAHPTAIKAQIESRLSELMV